MKDIFTKLQNFLSEPTSTMALIGTLMVLVSSFFVTPDRFCLVLTSFVAFLAVIAMRTIEVRLLNRLENRENTITGLYDRLGDLLAESDKRGENIARLEAELKEAQKPKENDVAIGPVLEAAQPAKKPQSGTARKKREEYSAQDVARIQEEMKSAGLVPEKED